LEESPLSWVGETANTDGGQWICAGASRGRLFYPKIRITLGNLRSIGAGLARGAETRVRVSAIPKDDTDASLYMCRSGHPEAL
jgi:hypothetical protein